MVEGKTEDPREEESRVVVIHFDRGRYNQILKDAGDLVRSGMEFPQDVTDEDLEKIFTRDTLGHRDLAKTVQDIFSHWFDLEGEDERLIEEIEKLNDRLHLQEILPDTFTHGLLNGHVFIYKNFKDTAPSPEDPIQNATDIVSLKTIYKPWIVQMKRVKDIASERFGLLDYAEILMTDEDTKEVLFDGKIHSDRLILLRWRPLYDSLKGMSYYSPAFDSYTAMKNTDFAMGETFHRNAAGTKLIKAASDATLKERKDLEAAFKELDVSKEIIVPQGTEVETIRPVPIPPRDYTDYWLKKISSMPQTILIGTQAGKVAGSETNLQIYFGDIAAIQNDIVSPMLLDLYHQLQDLHVLPDGDLPKILWRPLWKESAKTISETWHRNAMAARTLAGNDVRGDLPILSVGEIRRLIFHLEEEVPEEKGERLEQLEIPIDVRKRIFQSFREKTDRVSGRWGRRMKRVNDLMERDAIAILKKNRRKIESRFRRVFRLNVPEDVIQEILLAIEEGMEIHVADLEVSIREGYADAIRAGTETVSAVVERLEQTEIQTLIFPKSHWKSVADVKKWAKDHGFHTRKVDETGNSWRLRQRDPGEFIAGSFRTICLRGAPRNQPTDPSCSIKAVIGRPKSDTTIGSSTSIIRPDYHPFSGKGRFWKTPFVVDQPQGIPPNLLSWWDGNSTHWSSTLSTETIFAIKGAVRQGLERGESISEIEMRLTDVFDATDSRYEMIARTETIRAFTEARIVEYRRFNVQILIFMAAMDDRTDWRCLDLDGQEFPSEASSGIIPVHPNCRCTWIARTDILTEERIEEDPS